MWNDDSQYAFTKWSPRCLHKTICHPFGCRTCWLVHPPGRLHLMLQQKELSIVKNNKEHVLDIRMICKIREIVN